MTQETVMKACCDGLSCQGFCGGNCEASRTPPPVEALQEEVERLAGFFFRARMNLPQAETRDAWERSLTHHREMLAKYPQYGSARSLVHDCFRDAEIAIAALSQEPKA